MEKDEGCRTCPYFNRPGPVGPDGDPATAKFVFVGEGPGWDEIEEKKGFVGAAGQELWRLARAVGIERSMCVVTNVVKCLPVGAEHGKYKPDPVAIAHCRRFLEEELRQCKGTRVAIGGTALQALTGLEGILRWRGTEVPSI